MKMLKNKYFWLISLVLLVACLTCLGLSSCEKNKSLTVSVCDSSGTLIEGAAVILIFDGYEAEIPAITDKNGKVYCHTNGKSTVEVRLESLPAGYDMPEENKLTFDKDSDTVRFIVPVKERYHITVKTAQGRLIGNQLLHFYADAEKTDLKGFAITDDNGEASVSLLGGKPYYVDLVDISEGYNVASSYPIYSGKNTIKLETSVIRKPLPVGHEYNLGDVAYDLTIETVDGDTFTLSEILQNRDMVMLNFWYINCGFCIAEFSVFDEVYGDYSDKVGLIALNNYIDDTALEVNRFVDDKRAMAQNGATGGIEFTFDVAKDETQISGSLGSLLENGSWTAWPVSVIIDRYGVICLVIDGDIKSADELKTIFDYFTADDYVQKIFKDYDDFKAE